MIVSYTRLNNSNLLSNSYMINSDVYSPIGLNGNNVKPWGMFLAEDYDTTNKLIPDSSGNNQIGRAHI